MISGGPRIVNRSLIAAYDFGNLTSYIGSGTNINNLISNDFNGTLINGSSVLDENKGIVNFDGTDSYISLGPANQIIDINNFTMMCWMKSSDNGAGSDGYCVLMGTRYNYNIQLTNYVSQNTIATIFSTSVSGNITVGGGYTDIFDQIWHHCAITYNTGIIKIYIDGLLEIHNSTYSGQSLRTNSDIFGIGGDTGTRHFFGKIGIPKIYHAVLTDYEISKNYNKTKSRFL